MSEKHIEQKLVKAVKAAGGIAPKFISPGLAGMPDRLVLLPKGKMAFVEIKGYGLKPRPLQIKRKRQLEGIGFRVYIVDSPRAVEEFLQEVMG